MTTRQESAFAVALEQDPEAWGANEHMSFMRYLVLECSDLSGYKLVDGKLVTKDGQPLPDTAVVNLKTLREEFANSKLAECANFYKWQQELGNLKKNARKASKYA